MILALRYLVKDDVRMVPFIDDPERKVAPTRRKRMVWDEDEGREVALSVKPRESPATVTDGGVRRVVVAPNSASPPPAPADVNSGACSTRASPPL